MFTPRRILLMRECCIGDVLMSTPLLRALSVAWPETKIDYMVGEWSREILVGNKRVNEVVPYLNVRKVQKTKLPGKTLGLRNRGYDMVFVLDVGRGPNLLARLSGAPVTVGFDYEGNGEKLTHAVQRSVNDVHEREAFLRLADVVGAPRQGEKMECWLTDADRKTASAIWSKLGFADEQPVIGLFPGGGDNPGTHMPSKRWPAVRYRGLIDRIHDDGLGPVLLFGGPADGEVLDEVTDGLRGGAYRIDGLGLKELAAAVNRCAAFVTNDCGPMHISAAVGTPTISIWGPTDPALLAPAGELHTAISAGEDCPPCYKQILGTFDEGCETADCISRIGVDEVMDALLRTIEKGRE